jgi:hypothetical protein
LSFRSAAEESAFAVVLAVARKAPKARPIPA